MWLCFGGAACWGTSRVWVWGWRGAQSLACYGGPSPMFPSVALAPGHAPGCGQVGGAVEHVLCLHWGGWWVVLGLERLACLARLPGWCMLPSHELTCWAAMAGLDGWVGLG
ncbi:hypothetical protein ATANTOWER_017209 [Ataeniobius toweri]|uniref:Secreted protein n=1 Tax=Ataeniobius toweri TaxID=208326 RepID=A0ABU7B8V3_9TELE|nr:hypothetical protein [Ataeniobius toweri]